MSKAPDAARPEMSSSSSSESAGRQIVPDLEVFLRQFKLDSGAGASHTRFGDSYCSYFIPVHRNGEFYAAYAAELRRRAASRSLLGGGSGAAGGGGRNIGLVERHRDAGPVVIDLDFRYKARGDDGDLRRRHDDDVVLRFVRQYVRELARWVALPAGGTEVYVLQKAGPRVDKGLVKDGVHIVLPDVVTEPLVQRLVRRRVLPRAERVFESLGLCNGVEDVVDEAVIERNGWMMFGSGKPGDQVYEIAAVLRAGVGEDGEATVEAVSAAPRPPREEAEFLALVERLSIRNKTDVSVLCADAVAAVDAERRVEGLAREHIVAQPAMLQAGESHWATCGEDELLQARQLVRLLDDGRAETYGTWMRVGWCLHNIDHRLLRDWADFSRRSAKFEEGLCERLWDHMRYDRDGLGLGSLKFWAREDSPQEFERLARGSLSGKIRAAVSATHHDVAMVVCAIFGGRYVCTSVRNNSWYEFREHRWHTCDSGFSLRRFLSADVYSRFVDEACQCGRAAQAAVRPDGDESADGEHARFASMGQKLMDVAKKLKGGAFKDSVLKECRELLYRADFESLLDGRPKIVGFEDGVYDIETHEFRPGMPEDMVQFSTRQAFAAYDPDEPIQREIERFFEQIQPVRAVREYMLKCMGSFIDGAVREERFYVWTGVGSNGKSVCIDLFERAFGDYCCKLPVSLLTQRRAASNGATSEIARLKGKRFACLQEPGNDEVLNVGLMKELTGGDRIMARSLYKEPIEFRPMFKMVMTANALPEIRADDGGTWRRMDVTDFPSRFVEEPDPTQPLDFKLDTSLLGRLDAWAPHMMALLIHYYKRYRAEGNPAPDEVRAVTQQYRKNNDVVQLFIDDHLDVSDPEAVTDSAAIHELWRDFLKQHNIANCSYTKRNDVLQAICRHVRNSRLVGANQRVRGVSIRVQGML